MRAAAPASGHIHAADLSRESTDAAQQR